MNLPESAPPPSQDRQLTRSLIPKSGRGQGVGTATVETAEDAHMATHEQPQDSEAHKGAANGGDARDLFRADRARGGY